MKRYVSSLMLLLVFGLSATASAQSPAQPDPFTALRAPTGVSFGPSAGGSSEMQTPPVVALPSDSILWDKSDALMASEAITRFEVCVDATPCVIVSPATAKQPAPNALGTYQWKLPAITVGPHAIKVLACNTDLCSAPALLDIRLAVQTTPVAGLRVGVGKD